MKLAYRAFDRSGQAVVDTIEAVDSVEAGESLRRRGLFVAEITAYQGEAAAGAAQVRGRRVGRSRQLRHLSMFGRQLHVLTVSGTPMVQALGALERQVTDRTWRRVLGDVREEVEEGASLSEAMAQQPEHFDAVCRSLVAAGEQGGCLDAMLDRLASLARKQLHIRSAIGGAMVYPSLLIVVAVAVLIILLTFVLPRFAGLFKTLNMPLPPTTKALMVVSGVLTGYWWAVLLGLLALGLGVRYWLNTPGGQWAVDLALIRAPYLGSIGRGLATARIARLLGVLLDSHVPMLESLKLTREAAGNLHYGALIARAEEAVTRGEPISSAFADPRLISPSVHEAIRNGEQSGKVGTLLLDIADFLDEENEVVVRSLTSIIEPIILIVLGLLVGFVAVSMFMPLFDLTSMLHGGR